MDYKTILVPMSIFLGFFIILILILLSIRAILNKIS
jgi:nitrogen fixation-related uncharacterized protein